MEDANKTSAATFASPPPETGVKQRDVSLESSASTQVAGAPPSQVVKLEGKPLTEVGVDKDSTVEVLWEVEKWDGTYESVWWSASVGPAGDEVGAATLVYVPQHGFEQEMRRVIFLAGSYLWDCALKERLPYRREGEEGPKVEVPSPGAESAEAGSPTAAGADGEEEDEDEQEDEQDGQEEELALGCAVKARFQGGCFCAGAIQEVHEDGTYDVLYEDKVLEQNVPRDMIERIAGGDNLSIEERERGQVAAEGSETFFELFVTSLTNGPMFAKLSAEQQAFASEKVRAMKPHFDAELAIFREQRGWGAQVGAADIQTMVPKVMARSRGQAPA